LATIVTRVEFKGRRMAGSLSSQSVASAMIALQRAVLATG
jgi:hypothetical protein